MWLICGLIAVFTALLSFKTKCSQWTRFSSLVFTTLTVMLFYQDATNRVLVEDWGGLMDVLPTTSRMLWVCIVGSICINGLSLYREIKQSS